MVRHFKQGLWSRRLAASLACFLFLVPSRSTAVDGVEVGFLARAQRAPLVVIGMVRSVSVGLWGCGHDIDVENVLRGSLEDDRLSLHSYKSGCPPLSSPHRLILAMDGWDDGSDVMAQIAASVYVALGMKVFHFRYPAGTSWKVFLDENDYVFGELSDCSELNPGPVTRSPERMRLEDLIALLSGPMQLEGGPRQLEIPSEPRVIEGEVRDFYDLPMGMHLELVPLAHPDRAVAISTDDWGRFRVTGVPGEPIWLRSMENDMAPILLQQGVTVVHALLPSCSSHAQVWMR